MIIRKRVDFPAPFGPTRPTFSPGLSWKSASMNSTCRPYCLLTFENEIMGIRCAECVARHAGAAEDPETGDRGRGKQDPQAYGDSRVPQAPCPAPEPRDHPSSPLYSRPFASFAGSGLGLRPRAMQ